MKWDIKAATPYTLLITPKRDNKQSKCLGEAHISQAPLETVLAFTPLTPEQLRQSVYHHCANITEVEEWVTKLERDGFSIKWAGHSTDFNH